MDAVSNRNGFMTWKPPHRKRHGLHGTYSTDKSNHLCQREHDPIQKVVPPNTSSPRPNPKSSFGFSLRYSATAYRPKSQHFKTSLPVIAVWLSVYSKIHESCKSEVKPQIKVVIVQKSAALCARFTIFTSRASQFRARPFLKRCSFAVYNGTVSF